MTTKAIRVLIADDQRVVRDGLSMLVALIDDVEVVGTACDGAEAVRLARLTMDLLATSTGRPNRDELLGPDQPAANCSLTSTAEGCGMKVPTPVVCSAGPEE